jgi:beta-carotene ketolase (CrtO type)
MDAYRFEMQSLRSWCNETFEAEETKVLVGSFALHVGSAPDDAGGARLAWLFASIIQDLGNNAVQGGMHNLSLALAAYLKDKGGEIRTNAEVTKILVEDGRATAVRLESGEEIPVGKLVASNVDPRQLTLRLLGEDLVGAEVARKIRRYEWGDSVMPIYVALDGPVEYKAGPEARQSAYVHPTSATLDYSAQIYFEVRSGKLPASPFVLICNDSAVDPGRAPSGKALMKFVVQPVPYEIKGDATGVIGGRNWEGVKEQYADYVIDMLTESYIPDLKRKILKRVVHSPVDLERTIISAVHGTLAHGAFLPYQIESMRPIPEMGEYRSPVPNVYLCGSGSHPGPGVSMAPGRNAAQAIYSDLELDFPATLVAR